MKRLNHWIRASFGFSKSEANGMIILLPLAFCIVASPYIYKHFIYSLPENKFDYVEMDRALSLLEQNLVNDSIERAELWAEKYKSKYPVKSWKNPLQHGGQKFEETKSYYFSKKRDFKPIDINVADSIELKSIRGIGSVLSSRIIKYRNWLGGFKSKNQLKEVYGLNDSLLLALDTLVFVSPDYKPQLLDINNLSAAELKRHPYISYNIAKALDAYKFQHGSISSIDDLRKVKLMDSITLQKLLPYLNLPVDKD